MILWWCVSHPWHTDDQCHWTGPSALVTWLGWIPVSKFFGGCFCFVLFACLIDFQISLVKELQKVPADQSLQSLGVQSTVGSSWVPVMLDCEEEIKLVFLLWGEDKDHKCVCEGRRLWGGRGQDNSLSSVCWLWIIGNILFMWHMHMIWSVFANAVTTCAYQLSVIFCGVNSSKWST